MMMLDRAPFIDQSQSFSHFNKNPTVASMIKHHFFTWSNGAKTGILSAFLNVFCFIKTDQACITIETRPALLRLNFRWILPA